MLDIDVLRPFLQTTLESTDFKNLGQKETGKVRDVYIQSKECHPELVPSAKLRTGSGRRILIATDRQSAFDRLWCTIPLKGQILTQISAWWFERVKDIMPTHIIAIPDHNVMVVKDLQMIPIEIVVRGHLTGSTKTSAWVNYEKGIRDFCGNRLPDGMVKNQPFDSPIITPTTKSEDDELIDPKGILEGGLATKKQWEEISHKAFALFARGQEIAAEHGLILVDTKYEMGLDENGILTLADEVHTPDSSRYWRSETTEPLDKEFFRLWLREQGFEYGKPPPLITDDVRLELAQKYIDLYERITGTTFILPPPTDPTERMEKNLVKWHVS